MSKKEKENDVKKKAEEKLRQNPEYIKYSAMPTKNLMEHMIRLTVNMHDDYDVKPEIFEEYSWIKIVLYNRGYTDFITILEDIDEYESIIKQYIMLAKKFSDKKNYYK